MGRTVFHLDMDAFYAAIEQRDSPELRNKPVIVGGTGRRGVVSTASYEARPFGVHSAMPTYRARQLCPDGVFVPPRGKVYVEVSRQLMEILGRYTPDVEPLSLDEAFLDMTGTDELFGPPRDTAERILQDIERELSLTASIGVAPNKYIAKVASDMNKPRGLTVCPPGQEKEFLAPLPIERLWGVGPKSAPKLHALGLRKIGDVARWDASDLERRFGSFGLHVWQLANGVDDRGVERDREDKSMGGERTFDQDIRGAAAVRERLLPLCDHVAARLRKHGVRAGGVRIKVKYATFKTLTRQKKLPAAVSDSESLRATVEELLGKLDLDRPIRLVGLAAYALAPDDGTQAGLFDGQTNKREQLEHVLDAVNAKFGRGAVGRAGARSLGPGHPAREE